MKIGDIVVCKACPRTCKCIGRIYIKHGDGDWGFRILKQTWKRTRERPVIRPETCSAMEKELRVLYLIEELLEI